MSASRQGGHVLMARNRRAASRAGRQKLRTRWTASIRTRVLAIAVIPSAALLITGAVVAGYLISDGLTARSFADTTTRTIAAYTQFLGALEGERTLSLRAVGGDQQALAGLPAQWKMTDQALDGAESASTALLSIDPQIMASGRAAFQQMAVELSAMRQHVRQRQATPTAVDALYTQLTIGGASESLLLNALHAPDPGAAVDATTVLDLLGPMEEHSRAAGLGAGWAERGMLTGTERVTVAQLAGAYQNGLQLLAPRFTPAEQAAFGRLTAGTAWREATSGEDALANTGRLGMPLAGWLAAENTVSAGLLSLWGETFSQAESSAVSAASHTLSQSELLGSLAVALALAAFTAALVLANGVIRRLRRLHSNTLELADVRLPSLVRRIADGDRVDVDAEMMPLDYGSDEIGQVAEAFNAAQRTAVAAAAAEARTRGGINKVFLDIAHRSQLVVHRQLELLDVAEAKQGDPEHLELLFQLDHLATRARRNAENLLILGGGQPGRKWRNPAALEDVVRSAVSETEHFARVSTVRLPEVRVQGAVVGDLIHLLAELVDNATAFSPPDSAVTVRGNEVGKGVVVEVEDQGLGIEHAERERLNETLRHPPDFQEMALSGQRQLGLFVIGQLAQRHGITVTLLESAYGGTKAIVLVPADAIEAMPRHQDGQAPLGGPRRREPLPAVSLGDPQDRVPQLSGSRAANAATTPPPTPLPLASRQVTAAAAPPWEMAGDPVPGPARSGRAPLQRRQRLANLAPGLRPDADDTAGEPANGQLRSGQPRRSPEEARGSMSAFQLGTRRGRNLAGEDQR